MSSLGDRPVRPIPVEVRAHALFDQVGRFASVIEHLAEADVIIMMRHKSSPHLADSSFAGRKVGERQAGVVHP
jgi:hypothetical protein